MNETYFARYTMPNGSRHTENLVSGDLESAIDEAEARIRFCPSGPRLLSVCKGIVISGIPAFAIVAEFNEEFDRWIRIPNPVTQVI